MIRLSFIVHAAAIATLIVKPSAWPAVIAVLVVNHAAIGVGVMTPRSSWLGSNLNRLPSGEPQRFALTFDDGPDPVTTREVLDVLESAGMKATFFCIGSQALKHPDVVQEIRTRGHAIANHTFSHPNHFALCGPAALRREVQRAQEALTSISGNTPTFFRAPAGFRPPWLAGVLDEAGLQYVSWTRRGFDTVTNDSRVVADRLLKNLRAGDILLLHDRGSAVDSAGHPVVVEALKLIVRRAGELGLVSRPLV